MAFKKRFFYIFGSIFEHYEGKLKLPWPCKFFLISKHAKKIYARDLLTANDLTKQLRKKVSFFGNPFMDKFSFFEKNQRHFLLILDYFLVVDILKF